MKDRCSAMYLCGAILFSLLLLTSCGSHTVVFEPIEIKPIHINIDVNVKTDTPPASTQPDSAAVKTRD